MRNSKKEPMLPFFPENAYVFLKKQKKALFIFCDVCFKEKKVESSRKKEEKCKLKNQILFISFVFIFLRKEKN